MQFTTAVPPLSSFRSCLRVGTEGEIEDGKATDGNVLSLPSLSMHSINNVVGHDGATDNLYLKTR